ncbi:MAG: DUF1963 domain-containing protein [Paracoccaceae bacterium]
MTDLLCRHPSVSTADMKNKYLSYAIALIAGVGFAQLAVSLGISAYLILFFGLVILLFRRRINIWRVKAFAIFALFMLRTKLPGYRLVVRYVEGIADDIKKTPEIRARDEQRKQQQEIFEKSQREWQAAREKDKDRIYTQDEIAAYFDAHSDPTAYLIRECAGQGSFTQIGGLPRLAPDIAWPEHLGTGKPLHFLAQINLAEVPETADTAVLPREGTLWFFLNLSFLDGETVSPRVLYRPNCDPTWPRAPQPDTLPEIAEFVFYRAGEQGSDNTQILPRSTMACVVHPCLWQTNKLPKDRGAKIMKEAFDYGETHKQETFAQTIPTSGIANLVPFADGGPNYCPDAFGGLFPWNNLVATKLIHPIAERARNAALARPNEPSDDTELLLADLQVAAPYAELSSEHQARFDERIFRAAGYESVQAARDSRDDLTRLRTNLYSVLRTLKSQAGVDPDLLAAFPDDFLQGFLPYQITQGCNETMIGGPKFTTPNPTPGSGFKLLQIDSDQALGVTWGDVGLLEFWIDLADLAKRDFDKAQLWISSS